MTDIPKVTVESVGTHVYFYAGIDSDRTLALIQQLHQIDDNLASERSMRHLPDDFPQTPIWLHIQSYGGGVFESFNVANKLSQLRSPIYCTIDGLCASGGSILALACEKRYIQRNAMLTIHQLSSFSWGTFEQLKDDMIMMKKIMKQMTDFYVEHSNMDRKTIRKMLKRDTWFDADEALAAGLVHGII